jgi:hypothetical protein
MSYCRNCGAEDPSITVTQKMSGYEWGSAYYYDEDEEVVYEYMDERYDWETDDSEIDEFRCDNCDSCAREINELVAAGSPDEIERIPIPEGIYGFELQDADFQGELAPGDVYAWHVDTTTFYMVLGIDDEGEMAFAVFDINGNKIDEGRSILPRGGSVRLFNELYKAPPVKVPAANTDLEEPIRLADYIKEEVGV